MIQLLKYKRGQDDAVLLASNGEIEIQDCGVILRFKEWDHRKPDYAALMDDESVRNMVDDLLGYLKSKID